MLVYDVIWSESSQVNVSDACLRLFFDAAFDALPQDEQELFIRNQTKKFVGQKVPIYIHSFERVHEGDVMAYHTTDLDEARMRLLRFGYFKSGSDEEDIIQSSRIGLGKRSG